MAKHGTVKTQTWGELGGNNPMHPAIGTGTQTPGKSSQEGRGSISGSIEPQPGPASAGYFSTPPTNRSQAGQQAPGVTAQTLNGPNGDGKFAKGGTNPMFGNRGSLPAVGGRSSPTNG